MSVWMEIVIPVRNPNSKLLDTIDSLLVQTESGFGVVLSDNFSSSGLEHLDEAQRRLQTKGIAVRRVMPPFELGRVQHWNWAHAQAQSDWLKPLFVGDVLLPKYIARVHERVQERPASALIRCEFELRTPAGTQQPTSAPFSERTLTPQQFLAWFPSHGNWIGGPINVAYRRAAWQAAGGYRVHLPACADLNLNVTLALRHGLETVPETLAAFQLHEQRFSHGIVKRRVNGCFELWLILRQARNYCRDAGLIWPEYAVARGVMRQLGIDYWYPLKSRLKRKLENTKK